MLKESAPSCHDEEACSTVRVTETAAIISHSQAKVLPSNTKMSLPPHKDFTDN